MLSNKQKLFFVKLTHTAIWCIMVFAIFAVMYAGIFDRISLLTWVCIGLVFVEGTILFFYRWKCPLTLIAYKYTSNRDYGFDIFLPSWLAKHNKIVFSIIFTIAFVLVLWRVLN